MTRVVGGVLVGLLGVLIGLFIAGRWDVIDRYPLFNALACRAPAPEEICPPVSVDLVKACNLLTREQLQGLELQSLKPFEGKQPEIKTWREMSEGELQLFGTPQP